MRPRPFFLFSVLLFLSLPSVAQTTAPQRDAQGALLLRNALAAMTGSSAINDATLTGTVERVAGSLDESGTATLKGTAAGASFIEFSLPSGTTEESRDLTAQPAAGTWERAGGAAQPVASHNLGADPTWFYPALLMARALGNASYGIVYAGPATVNGVAVNDVRINSYPLGPPGGVAIAQTLGRTDLYLAAGTNLPVALDFNAHPDNNALTDLAVEVRFLNYTRQGAALVSMEIQEYLNNSLLLDIHVTSAQFNTGLTSSALAVQ